MGKTYRKGYKIMKISFVISALRKGGAERVLQNLANMLCKEHECKIVIFEEDEGYYKFDPKIEILNLHIYDNPKPFKRYFVIRKYLKNDRPDIVISFIDWTNIGCIISNFGLKSKIIATEHMEYQYMKKYSFIRDFTYKFADAVTVLTQDDYNYFAKINKKTYLINNPFFGEIPMINQSEKENIILCVARLEKQKNHALLIRALSKIDKNLLSNWRVQFAGDGSLKDELINLAKNLNVNIEFLGQVKNISDYYKKAKIFALSSDNEGLPNVLIEAMFFGCARVATAASGSRDLIMHEKSGLLCKIGDENELSANLTRVMSDEKFRLNLVENANKKLDEFMLENVVKKWEKLISEIVK